MKEDASPAPGSLLVVNTPATLQRLDGHLLKPMFDLNEGDALLLLKTARSRGATLYCFVIARTSVGWIRAKYVTDIDEEA